MDMKLAENIRTFRKQRSLTQEQLAEVLGVTVGAVYKWEAKLSMPELRLIVEMADFFDISVDVLLGYEMKDNRLENTLQRLREYRHKKDLMGIAEAEKALKKYPNNFGIVYNSAVLYRVFGLESQDKHLLYRALELLENSRLLLTQNTDPQISELTIYGDMAEVYLALDENDQAIELLKNHNASGIYSDLIGMTLASSCSRPLEAMPFLSEALLKNVASLMRIIIGYMSAFLSQKDYASAKAILSWGIDTFSGLNRSDKPCFLDKMNCVFFTSLAYVHIKTGCKDAAYSSLTDAKELARRFDQAPTYDGATIKFVSSKEQASAHDDLGTTAADSIQNTINTFADDTLSAMWKELTQTP